MRVHPSNFRIVGFTARPSLEEFVDLSHRRNIPTFEDLGSGCLATTDSMRAANEPIAGESIRAGVDIISFSGDKLLGGPQAGIIAGKKLYVEKVRRNPLFRALRVDKLTIGAFEYVLQAYLRGETAAIPTWRMLSLAEPDVKSRAEAFAKRAGDIAEVVRLTSLAGAGSAPEAPLPSWGVKLNIRELSAAEVERRLRNSNPPVIVRIDDGQVLLDFRTIFESEEEDLFRIVCNVRTKES